jgi:hypothetical protein
MGLAKVGKKSTKGWVGWGGEKKQETTKGATIDLSYKGF